MKKKRKQASRPTLGTFDEARAFYGADLEADYTLQGGSKIYRGNCIQALLRTWPELDALSPNKMTENECRAWTGRFAE